MPKRSDRDIRSEELGDMASVMQTEASRRVIRRIMVRCGMFESGFRSHPNVRPEERLVFNAAWRDMGQWLHDEAQAADPEGFARMNQEARARVVLDAMPAPKAERAEEENDASAT